MKRDIQWLLGPQVDEDSVDVPGDDAGFEFEDAFPEAIPRTARDPVGASAGILLTV